MSEQRLIDAISFEKSLCDEAEAFLKLVTELAQNDPIQALKYATKCNAILEIAQKMFATPTVDAVSVVRCEDCVDGRYDRYSDCVFCENTAVSKQKCGFCDQGKRR